MPTRQHRTRKTNDKVVTKSVYTQTDENSFCLCFIPEYMAQMNDEKLLDPRIKIMLDNINSSIKTAGKITCVVRNFEQKPKWTAKQRWKISGDAIRAVGKLKNRKKKKLMNITLTDYEDQELQSGFYSRNVEYDYEENSPNSFTRHRRRFSLKGFGFKRNKRSPQRSYSEYQDRNDYYENEDGRIFEAKKGNGKSLSGRDQMKSQENLIIESFINECLRESVRNNEKKNNENGHSYSDSTDESTFQFHVEEKAGLLSSENDKERVAVTRSITIQDSPTYGERQKDGKNKDDRRETVPRENRRISNEIQAAAERKRNRRPKSHYIEGREISQLTERQKRASEKYLNYLESDKIETNSRISIDNNSEHGSTLSAFALVPGTALQRKLSQRGINDKASIDIIKQNTPVHRTDRKYMPPPPTKNSKYGRRSFHSVENIYASSSSSTRPATKRHSSHMTQNLHNSFSADDIDDAVHLFKPLTNPTKEAADPLQPSIFVVTSTPREVEDVPEEQEEEQYATYV